MMRLGHFLKYSLIALACAACMDIPQAYSDVNSVTVKPVWPEGFEDLARAGVKISVQNILNGSSSTALTDDGGTATISLPDGLYLISASDRKGTSIFNGTADKVSISGDSEITLPLERSEGGSIVIKEIYVGGCSMAPKEGTYQADKYVILHNNVDETVYLDSLCFGTVSPYNSTAVNPWTSKDGDGNTVFKPFVPIIQAVWQIAGDGKTFPLGPGEDAVICINGAIDHTVNVPLSVNLNNPDYFVCYNNGPNNFPNTAYHPAPGDKIRKDHILSLVIKTGIANAYAVSISSPVIVVFRAKGTTIQKFVSPSGDSSRSDNVIQIPGSTNDYVVAVPTEWIIDGVEVFDGRSTSNSKRLMPSVDAGFVYQTNIFKGHSLYRKTDKEASELVGYEVLQDTNNSTNDFYERETQSLHK